MFEVLIFASLAILIGLAFCFMGYPFFRILLPIWAFFAGFLFGISAMDSLFASPFLGASMGLVVGFIVGGAFAAISYFVYSLAVIIFGATIGFVLGSGLLMVLGLQEGFLTWTAGIVMAVVFAGLFVSTRMPRFLVMLVTSLAGATAVLTGVFVLFGKLPPEMISYGLSKYMYANSPFWFIIWIVVAAFGFAVQYSTVNMAEATTTPYSMETVYVTEEKAKELEQKEDKKKKTK